MKHLYHLFILFTLPFFAFEKSGAQQSNSTYTISLPNGANYIHVITPEKEMQSVPTNAASHNDTTIDEEVQYFDGLGRPLQNVSVKASAAGKDIVQPLVYDNYGREADKYLPFTLADNNGALVANPIDASSGQKAFYESLFAGEGINAKSHIAYEPSHLNRVVKQGAPGGAWQPNSNTTRASDEHVVSIDYQTNTATDDVAKWEVSSSDECVQNGSYNAGTLYVTQTTDENSNSIKEYKDLQGHMVLKSAYDGIAWLKTYYVYNDLRLLRFVLPPKAVQALAGIPDIGVDAEIVTASKTITEYVGKSYFLQPGVTLTLGVDANKSGFHCKPAPGTSFRVAPVSTVSKADVMNQLAYQYTYDSRKRMVAKKLPGADWVYMVYDNRDRLVLTQDGEQHKNNKWLFTKYDALNRPVMTGITTNKLPVNVLRDTVNLRTGYKLYETAGVGNVHTYTNNSFPKINSSDSCLSVTYYDNYDFPGKQSFDDNTNISGYSDTQGDNRYFDRIKGYVTGTKTKVLETSIWLTSTTYYDDKYHVIQGQRDLYGSNGGKEVVSTLYDFVGKVKQTRQSQTFNSTTTTLDKWYSYDHAGRLLKTEQQINGANKTTLSEMTYNELGQLQQKKLGGTQNVDYQYNIRGWLTQINDPDNLGTDLFGMKLLYNDPNASLGNSSQFNGNVSGMVWKNKKENDPVKGYAFSYDAVNRLTGSDYKTAASGTWAESNAFEEKSLLYDANGNITRLIRTGKTGIDTANYTYHYSGNQLTDISSGTAYKYDKNGNTTKDGVRGFDISYNLLNLPKTISKGSDNLSYIYSASGEKLAKQVNGVTNQYYAGSMVYNDTRALDYLLHEEGMVKKLGSSFTYEYFLKDHLGNNRVVFIPGSSTPEQVTEYYPFGMSYQNNALGVNKYLYNGKELQDETLGGTFLGIYDFKWRFYDPQICRFISVDRLATKYPWYSPYQFAGNEVPNAVDIDGLEPAYPMYNGYFTTARDGQMQYMSPNEGAEAYFTNNPEHINPSQLQTNDAENLLICVLGSVHELITGQSPNGGEGNRLKAAAEILPLLVKGGKAEGAIGKGTTEFPMEVKYNNGYRTSDGKFASPTGKEPPAGKTAEQGVWNAIKQKEGWTVTEGRVYVKDANGNVRVYDGAATSPSGNTIGLEVKSGTATKTSPQKTFDSNLNSSPQNTATGTGINADLIVKRALEIRVK